MKTKVKTKLFILLLLFLSGFVLFGQNNYDSLGPVCYVDSVNGNDSNNGLTESTPKKSLAAVPASTVVVRLKRGSVFMGRIMPQYSSSVKVYTNYGPQTASLPRVTVSSDPGQGPVIISWIPLTIDGLHLTGARGDNTMVHDFTPDANGKIDGIVGGIGAFLGGATTFINNEINDCDIGIMVAGQNTVIRGNNIHDLVMGIDDDPGVDPNLVGGAEGIFVNAANVEVCYNRFVNCTGPAKWVGGYVDCDGGATEVSLQATDDPNADVYNVQIHHNFSYNCCGFFEVAAYFDETGQNRKGTFRDSSFHDNMIIDSGWMALLQVNNTILKNVQFNNNTLIQHPGTLNEGMLWSIFTATSSGMTGGDVQPNTVFLTNNIFVYDRVTPNPQFQNDPDFVTRNNIQRTYTNTAAADYNDIGFANIAGTNAEDFDLVKKSSPAVDAGVAIAGTERDYFDRSRPNGNAPDIGAFEYYANAAMTGDVNGSGRVDIIDALMTAQYSVGLNPAGFIQAAADTNSDGNINIVDALIIAQYYVGLVSVLPV